MRFQGIAGGAKQAKHPAVVCRGRADDTGLLCSGQAGRRRLCDIAPMKLGRNGTAPLSESVGMLADPARLYESQVSRFDRDACIRRTDSTDS